MDRNPNDRTPALARARSRKKQGSRMAPLFVSNLENEG
jgi:hypothetical protein